MDLPSALLGACWLIVAEAVVVGIALFWHWKAPVDRSKDAEQLARQRRAKAIQ